MISHENATKNYELLQIMQKDSLTGREGVHGTKKIVDFGKFVLTMLYGMCIIKKLVAE